MTALYKRILIPLDGSEFAATALPHAKEIARRFDAELVLLLAVQETTSYMAAGEPGTATTLVIGPDSTDITRQIEAGKRNMAELATQVRKEGITTLGAVEVGYAAECIVDYARANRIDLIVMSTHGRTGLARLAFGSVTSKVLEAATCPVLIIRPNAG